MATEVRDFSIQQTVYRALQDRPDWRAFLIEMVDHERAHEGEPHYQGWEWAEVHTPPSQINGMITRGIVDQKSKSRTYTVYRLRSLVATEESLDDTLAAITTPVTTVNVDALFGLVFGHDRIKQLLRYALRAESAVHCLMVGPVGTAKTLILSDIGNLPGAQFYLGSTTTRSGLVGLLLSERPAYLVIDEIDKMDAPDMSPLLSLMETGMVMRLQHGHHERIQLATRVFAGANDVRRLSAPILNRFAKFEIEPYTRAQFIDVARNVLTKREGLGPEMSLLIASEVAKHSLDIRDAVRVARMTNRDPRRVTEIVTCLWPEKPPLAPVPLRRE